MNKRNISLLYITFVFIFVLIFFQLFNSCRKCQECEGLSDGSFCMPNTNKLFYLKTKLGKKIYLDLKNNRLSIDSLQQSAFFVRGCLRDIFNVTYLRYSPNNTNFTTNFNLIKVGSKMEIETVKDLKNTNEDILFIKRVYTNNYKYVRLGLRHNKKFYWYNETQEGTWLWTTNLKDASSFEIVYY